MEENYVSDIDIISALKTIKSKNPRVIIDELMKICKVSGNTKDDISILVGVLWKNN
jgi:ATP-dependent Lon protease